MSPTNTKDVATLLRRSLSSSIHACRGQLQQSPVRANMVSCSAIFCVGDAMAQEIEIQFLDKTQKFNLRRCVNSAGIGFCMGVPFTKVYTFAEQSFPGRTFRNVLLKVGVSCSILSTGGNYVNMLVRRILQEPMDIQPMQRCQNSIAYVNANFLEVLKTDLCVWPAYDCMCFTLIPPLLRPMMTAAMACAWSAYISFVANRKRLIEASIWNLATWPATNEMAGVAGMFGFMLIPGGVLVLSAVLGTMTKNPKTGEAMLQHFAGGVVLSAVASELVPEMKRAEASIWAVVLGFLLAVTMLLIIRIALPKEDEHDSNQEDKMVLPGFQRRRETEGFVPWGSVVPTLIDLLCNGMLVGLSCAVPAASAGGILSISIALEMASLGAALLTSMKKSGVAAAKAIRIVVVLAVAMTLSAVGSSLAADAIQVSFKQGYYAALAFGIAACSWLACEDLLMQAHENGDKKWFVTAVFFIGFLIPILLTKLSGEG